MAYLRTVSPARQQARWGMERLLHSAKKWLYPRSKGVVEVVYPQWFRKGECIMGIRVSLKGQPSWLITAVGTVHTLLHYRYSPVIVNTRYGSYLALTWRFPKIGYEEHQLLPQYAAAIAKWAEMLFGTSAIVVPSKGLLDARRRLHAHV